MVPVGLVALVALVELTLPTLPAPLPIYLPTSAYLLDCFYLRTLPAYSTSAYFYQLNLPTQPALPTSLPTRPALLTVGP